MFLRANARSAGLVDEGEPLQATYAAAIEGGSITGVAAHCWNGMVLVQAPAHAPDVARAAVRHSGRAITGFSGPWSQVVAARKQGVRRAVLFADPSNAAARAAYLAIGFVIVGDYGLVLFAP